MIRRTLVSLALLAGLTPAWAVEVASMVSCRADGEVWLCARWQDGEMEVFHSERYLSEVNFRNPPPETPLSPGIDKVPSLEGQAIGEATRPRYTLQLWACHTLACLERVGKIEIPGSRMVYIKGEDKLWQLLVAGEFTSMDAARQAAGELMTRYNLREKPWVRSLASLRNRQLAY